MHRPFLLLVLLMLLGACSSGEGGGSGIEPDPPHEGTDTVDFRVLALEADGGARTLWHGTVSGPADDSPQRTARPWVGFGTPFRIEWDADAEAAPVTGTRFRPGEALGSPFLPLDSAGESVWGQLSSFDFANDTDPIDLVGVDCDGGPGCPERARLDSGPHLFQVLARTSDGDIVDSDFGALQYEVNFPPRAFFDEGDGYPVYRVALASGGQRETAVAAGDTIAAGSVLRLRLGGFDRLDGVAPADSFCCDERLDPREPEIRYQAYAELVRVAVNGLVDTFRTQAGEALTDSVLTMVVGPFDYTVRGRVLDEHGRLSDEVHWSFVGGFEPAITEIDPAAGALALLSSPDKSPPPSEVDYEVVRGLQWAWDASAGEWLESGEGGDVFPGDLFRIPLRFSGQPRLAVRDVLPSIEGGYTGHVRSFAYEWFSEFDPDNRIAHGGGSDRLDLYQPVNSLGTLLLEGSEAVEIYVPSIFWALPALFDPDGDCSVPLWCQIGERLRRELGEITVRVRARTTDFRSEIAQTAPVAAGGAAATLNIELDRHGRSSPTSELQLAVRLAITDESGTLVSMWPPEGAPKR